MAMAVVELTLFGGFQARLATGQVIDLPGQKDRALLAILVLSAGATLSRDKLASLLWSDRGDQQARDSLKHSLTRLRQCLEPATPSPIVADRQSVKLDLAALGIDVAAFERLLLDRTPQSLEKAAELYRGDLLEGIGVRDPAFEDWLLVERQRLRQLAEDALTTLVAQSLADESLERAGKAARRLLALDPLRETACRALMQIHAKSSQSTQALKLYESLRERLHRELGVKPEPQTTQLYESIRQGRTAPPSPFAGSSPAQPAGESETIPPELPLPSKPSIAVLPFRIMSDDPEQQYFVDGLTEDLITDLSQVPDLFVIARNSSFAYKGKLADVRDIARNLGVHYVLEGSARRAAGRVRINVQLIDAIGGGHVWAERFDRSIDDIFDVQDEVTARIVEALAGRLTVPKISGRRRAANLEAYDLCVRGRALVWQSPQAVREARLMFERAIALDPKFAEAHRWLAYSLHSSWKLGGEPMEPNREPALAAVQNAIALDPNDAGARGVYGFLLTDEHRWKEAEAEFAVALKLDPSNADAWAMLSELMVLSGRSTDALADIQKALRLNPHPPGWYYWLLGQAQYLDRQYDQAVESLRREETYRMPSRRTLAASLAQLGQLEEARREAQMFMTNNPHFTIHQWVESQPFRDAAACEHFVDGYRKAGLPE